MNADERRSTSMPKEINQLTELVIGCAYTVSNTLGHGFLEKVYEYENALAIDLRRQGIDVIQQYPISVEYAGEVVGSYVADLYIDRRLIVELKATKQIDPVHVAQCINYLKATKHHVGLILNFGKPKIEVKRLVHQLPE